jgi:serine/threonine-protein kinase RsbW
MPDLTAPRSGRSSPPDGRLIPGTDNAFTVRLPRSKSAPAALRRMIGAIAPRCEATEVVQLLGTEVVTNALIHAPTDAGGQIAVTARLSPPLMHVEVTGEGEFRPDYVEDRQTGGHGLALVEALSESWGIDRIDSGVTVWFTVGGFPTEA